MRELEFIFAFIRPLNKLDIPYFITGSMAAIIYGEPRLTHDVDIVLNLQDKNIEPFFNAFKSDAYYVPPIEVIKIEAARHRMGHFNLIYKKTGFKADIYLKGNDELHDWAFKNCSVEIIEDQKVYIAPPEYVIIRKLMYFREGKSGKHLDDITNIFRHSVEMIDLNFINK